MEEISSLREYFEEYPQFFPPYFSNGKVITYMGGTLPLTVEDFSEEEIRVLKLIVTEWAENEPGFYAKPIIPCIDYLSFSILDRPHGIRNFAFEFMVIEYCKQTAQHHGINVDLIEDAISSLSIPNIWLPQIKVDYYIETLILIGFDPEAESIKFLKNRAVSSNQEV